MHEIDPSAHIIHAIEKLAERLDNIALAELRKEFGPEVGA